MPKKLIIAEKPDAARTIAQVITDNWKQTFRKGSGYLESALYVVSWCAGHLVTLAEPADYDPKYKKWNLSDLPIIPAQWKYEVPSRSAQQFGVLKALMEREDIIGIVNAADAGREGELIFRRVYHFAGCHKPVKRLWASTTAAEDIKNALLSMKDGPEYDSLYYAADCRSMQDWLIGMNATRKYSKEYNSLLTIGRVQTPTLAMVVKRDEEIEGFVKSVSYKLSFQDEKGTVFQTAPFETKEEAEAAQAACAGLPAVVTGVAKKQKKTHAPTLYSTTELQKDASRLYGYSPKETLDRMQALYDHHVQSYPRTDATVISSAQKAQYPKLLEAIYGAYQWPVVQAPNIARLVDDKKITDHPAVTTTREFSAATRARQNAKDQTILDLVACRMVMAVAPDHISQGTTVSARCGQTDFTAKGSITLEEGWRAYKKILDKVKADTPLPAYAKGDALPYTQMEIVEIEADPPSRYTSSTLLEAMEKAGKKEMNADVERTGIGTSATRAEILERLVKSEYITISGKKNTIVSTDKGRALIHVMPPSLKGADMTVEWENRMLDIRLADRVTAREMSDRLMAETIDFVNHIVSDFSRDESLAIAAPQAGKDALGRCPACGRAVYENERSYYCCGYKAGCKFSIWKTGEKGVYPTLKHSKKKLTPAMAKKLLEKGKTAPLKLVSPKTQKEFEACLVIDQYAPGRFGLAFAFEPAPTPATAEGTPAAIKPQE